jgi:hypothetical protein
MSDVRVVDRLKKRDSPLRDKPADMSLQDWIKLREQQRQDKVNARLDGLIYERDPEDGYT